MTKLEEVPKEKITGDQQLPEETREEETGIEVSEKKEAISQKEKQYDYLQTLKETDLLQYEDELRRLLLTDPNFLPTLKQLNEAYRHTEEIWNEEVRNNRYELLNQDYIARLAEYLIKKFNEIKKVNNRQPILILEIGAGDGRLSHFLKNELIKAKFKEGVDFNIVASDNFQWKIKPQFSVVKIDEKEAVEKFQPQFVIASWLPRGSSIDFIRQQQSVQEYLLMGQPDATATDGEFQDHKEFKMSELLELSRLQASRNDDPSSLGYGSKSKTFSFARLPGFDPFAHLENWKF